MNTQTAVRGNYLTNYIGGFMSNTITQSNAGSVAASVYEAYNSLNASDIIKAAFEQAAAGNEQAAAFVQRLQIEAKAQQTLKTFQKQAAAASVDVEALQSKFLSDKEKQSKHTAAAYKAGLKAFNEFCEANEIDAAALTPGQADDFIRYLQDSGASSATINLRKSTLKAFYSFLMRAADGAIIVNPFVGSQIKVKAKAVHKCIYPTREEVLRIISYFKAHEATGKLAQIASIMAADGFRIGAFQDMVIEGNTAKGVSKGKEYAKQLSKASLDALAGLQGKPFASHTTLQWQHLWQKHIHTMYEAGLLREEFSPHDFRHHFATELYKSTKDIKAVQQALNHSSVAITDIYLKGLGVLTD